MLGSRAISVAAHGAQALPTDFDLFVKKLGGKIPFPPEEIFEKLGTSTKTALMADLFPHGRSLERDFTDFADPRAVFVWAEDPVQVNSPRVFLGYTPKKQQLEVISFNSNTRKYDFRVITDYGPGKSLKITFPPRAVCTACHQGGLPIFSVAPWSETTEDVDVRTRLKNEAKDPFAKFLLSKKGTSGTVPFVNVSAFEVDLQVRKAEQLAALPQDCASSCPNDIECRRKVLSALVFFHLRDDRAKFHAVESYELALGYPEGKLRDRVLVPGKERDVTFVPEPNPALLPDPRRGVNLRLDPLDPSVSLLPFEQAVYACFSDISDEMRRKPALYREVGALAKSLSFADMMEFLRSSKTADFLAKNWPIHSDKAISYLRQALRPQDNSQDKTTPARIVDKTPVSGKSLSPKEAALRYCAQCHYGQGSLAPTLPLEDLSLLGKYRSPTRGSFSTSDVSKSIVATYLEKHVMPPKDADQPTDEERAALIEATKRW